MQTVVNNLIVNYEFLENPLTNEYLVVLPGWMRSSVEWLKVAEAFRDKYNIVILDFPGFGITSKPSTDFDTYDYADFIKSFLAKIGVSRCTLLGHSFGGRVAIILTTTTDLVKNLVLVDSAGLKTGHFSIKPMRLLFSILKSLQRFLPRQIRYRINLLVGSHDYKNAGEMRKPFVKIVNQNLNHMLHQIAVPTLIVWGDKDTLLSVKQTKILKKEIQNSSVRIVWGSGHSPHTEKPEKFIEILREYLC